MWDIIEASPPFLDSVRVVDGITEVVFYIQELWGNYETGEQDIINRYIIQEV